ncbi:MAG: hypothetical protein AAB434_03675 [Planctomycetota bacterium]
MKGAYVTAAVTVLLAGVAIAIWSGKKTPPPKPKPPVEAETPEVPSPPDTVHGAPDAHDWADQAAEAGKRGDLDRAITLYDKSLALREDRDVAAARERVRAAIAERQKGFDAQRAEDEKKSVLAEAARLEGAGKLEEAVAKFEERLKLGDDATAREGLERVKRAIEERKKADAERQVRERFEGLVAEARGLQADGEFEKAVAKYEEALGVRDDAGIRAARDEAVRLGKMAAFRGKWGFAPRADELSEDDWGRLTAAGDLFLAAWADRDDPDRDLPARTKDLEAADAAFKALPSGLKKHPTFLFLNGAQHFLVAMGIYDDFLARRDKIMDIEEQEKLTRETVPIYNGELTTAAARLKAAREATDGHFATCFFEALSRAWRSDKTVSDAGKLSLGDIYQTIEPLTPFDDELRQWHAERGIFRDR